jgi:hypothetical protein
MTGLTPELQAFAELAETLKWRGGLFDDEELFFRIGRDAGIGLSRDEDGNWKIELTAHPRSLPSDAALLAITLAKFLFRLGDAILAPYNKGPSPPPPEAVS